jgi:hypothetical protein
MAVHNVTLSVSAEDQSGGQRRAGLQMSHRSTPFSRSTARAKTRPQLTAALRRAAGIRAIPPRIH